MYAESFPHIELYFQKYFHTNKTTNFQFSFCKTQQFFVLDSLFKETTQFFKKKFKNT